MSSERGKEIVGAIREYLNDPNCPAYVPRTSRKIINHVMEGCLDVTVSQVQPRLSQLVARGFVHKEQRECIECGNKHFVYAWAGLTDEARYKTFLESVR